VQLFSGDGDAVWSGGGDDDTDGDDSGDVCKSAQVSATAVSGSGAGWGALLDRLQEERKPAVHVPAGSEHGWVRLTERMRRRVFGERVVQATTGYFDGYGYSHFRIAGAYGHFLLDGELTKPEVKLFRRVHCATDVDSI
jgi:hypothetical protein